jgi:hypothetical protein
MGVQDSLAREIAQRVIRYIDTSGRKKTVQITDYSPKTKKFSGYPLPLELGGRHLVLEIDPGKKMNSDEYLAGPGDWCLF